MHQQDASKTSKTSNVTQHLLFFSTCCMLLFMLSACCPPYCGERYDMDYYCPLEITTVHSGNGYVAQVNGEGFNNLELEVSPSEFATTCTGTLEVTKNYAELIKKQPNNFKVVMRRNCSMAIVRSK